MGDHWNLGIFFEPAPGAQATYFVLLLEGLRWTVVTALASWAVAFPLGSLVGALRNARSKTMRLMAGAWIEVFRGVPLLVQLLLWFTVLPDMAPPPLGSWIERWPPTPFGTATLGLGLYTSARVALHGHAGLVSLARIYSLAGTALGLSRWRIYVHLLLPLAYREALGPLTHEFGANLKATSVALAIGLLELTARARSVAETSSHGVAAFAAAFALYGLASLCVVLIGWTLRRLALIPGVAPRGGH